MDAVGERRCGQLVQVRGGLNERPAGSAGLATGIVDRRASSGRRAALTISYTANLARTRSPEKAGRAQQGGGRSEGGIGWSRNCGAVADLRARDGATPHLLVSNGPNNGSPLPDTFVA